MSIDLYNYCGAFVRLFPGSLERVENYMGCGNTGCIEFGQKNCNSFCGNCGLPVVQMEDSYSEEYSYHQWADVNDFVDEMHCMTVYNNDEQQTYLFPNSGHVSAKTAIFAGYSDYETEVVDITKIDSEIMKSALITAYMNILTGLVQAGFKYEILFGYFKGVNI